MSGHLRQRQRKPRPTRPAVAELLEVLENRLLLADGISPSPGATMMVTAGVPLTNVVVASFTITDPSGAPGSKWNALVAWGDGGSDRIAGPSAGPAGTFDFLGTHTYAAAGSYTITVMIAVPGSGRPNDNTVKTQAIVSPPPAPSISINNVSLPVNGPSTVNFPFSVTLSSSSNQPVTVHYATADGTATVADHDYQAVSGNLIFNPGETLKTIDVPTFGIATPEPIESFFLKLSNPTNASVTTSQGIATILNHDPAVSNAADFNGDGKSDIAVYGPYGQGGLGRIAVLESGGGVIAKTFGGPLDQPVVGDFDGDGKTDIAVYGPYGPGGVGRLAVLESGGGVINMPFGGPLDHFVSGDFDGDGKTDIAVYGPYGPGGVGRLAVLESGGHGINIPFGGSQDTFISGDFDGDGKTDMAVYGPYGPNGVYRFAVLFSGGGGVFQTIGDSLDQPLVGDFNGDGKADFAVYGPHGPNGLNRLAVLLSGGGTSVQTIGGPLDHFVSGDFDGDGKTDIAVYGPYGPGGVGRLAVLESGGGAIDMPFGGPLDIPLPAPQVPLQSASARAAFSAPLTAQGPGLVAGMRSPGNLRIAAAGVALATSNSESLPGLSENPNDEFLVVISSASDLSQAMTAGLPPLGSHRHSQPPED